MAFPRINTKAKNYTVTPEIEVLLEKRLATLDRLVPENGDVICDVELSRTTEHHQGGPVYRAEINLKLGGHLLRAEATEETMEFAIDHAKNELKAELRKLTSKNESMFRRGARRAKEMFRFGN